MSRIRRRSRRTGIVTHECIPFLWWILWSWRTCRISLRCVLICDVLWQAGGNMADFVTWRKRPPNPQFLHFLRSHRLDPEDDDEDLTQCLSPLKTAGASTGTSASPAAAERGSTTPLQPSQSKCSLIYPIHQSVLNTVTCNSPILRMNTVISIIMNRPRYRIFSNWL